MDNQIMVRTMRLVTDKLTLGELSALYLAAVQGFDPTPVEGYEKAKPLFTERGGTRMHQATLEAFGFIVDERMKQEK